MKDMIKLRMSNPDIKVSEFLKEENKQAVVDALKRAHDLISSRNAHYETVSTHDTVEITIIPFEELLTRMQSSRLRAVFYFVLKTAFTEFTFQHKHNQ
jgi:hypothetical protein